MRAFIEAVPWFLPGVAFVAVLGILVAPALGRFLQTRSIVAFLLVLSVGAILFATLSPTAVVLAVGSSSHQACDLSRLGLASIAELTSINDTSRNVVLFIPLGLTLALLPPTRRTLAVVLSAILLTVLIEMTQLLLPALGRGCESADIIDNTMGLMIGLGVGLAARSVVAVVQRADT